mgnify:FL=1
MKKIENNFTVSGFVGKDAEIRQFANASVARFSLAVGRQEKNGEETNRVSAFMNMEAWRKNEHTESFDKLTKGTLLTVEGFFKPEEWTDKDGVKHSRIHHGCNQVLRVSRQGGDSCGRAGQTSNQERQEIAFPLHNKATFGSLLFCSGTSICCYSV